MKRPAGLGVCVPLSSINHDGARIDAMLAELQPDWWMNWSYNTYGAQDDRFVPMIWGNQWSEGAVQDALTSLSPRTWLIHNEPHRQDQANLTPKEAAADVRRFMRVAWETGVEFQMALGGCGVVDETTDGIAWMRELMYNLRRTGLSRSSYMHFHGYRFNSVAQMQTELRVMDMDGSHRERVTFIHDPNHADYVPRAADEAVRVFPFSKTRHGLYLDVVKNTFAGVQLHGEAQIWHLCL